METMAGLGGHRRFCDGLNNQDELYSFNAGYLDMDEDGEGGTASGSLDKSVVLPEQEGLTRLPKPQVSCVLACWDSELM